MPKMGRGKRELVLHSVGEFTYRHYGDLATVGRKIAIVSVGRFYLRGFSAWIFWSVAHIYYLIGVRNRAIVALAWLWEYVTFRRGARLINRSVPTPLAEAATSSPVASSSPENDLFIDSTSSTAMVAPLHSYPSEVKPRDVCMSPGPLLLTIPGPPGA